MALISFLPAFVRRWFSTSTQLPTPTPLSPTELLSRFQVERHYKRDQKSGTLYATWKAFEAKFDVPRQRYECSVFRTSTMSDPEIWGLAAAEVERTRNKRVIARMQLDVAGATYETLVVEPDEPPAHHAVIIGWPDAEEAKPQRKSLSQELAARSEVFERSESA